MRLVLASASPRRAELLRSAGFEFEVFAVDVDESVLRGEAPEAYVRRLANAKVERATDLLRRRQKGPAGQAAQVGQVGKGTREGLSAAVLGADTAVVLDGVILGKPAGAEEAAAMLRRLSGRTHEVLTGISLRVGDWTRDHVEKTTVEFCRLAESDVDWYVKSGEGRDKAGGYAIQGLASRFVPRIDGSYSNVVGLPIAALQALLAEIASRPLPGYPTH
jgi:septum formation protein